MGTHSTPLLLNHHSTCIHRALYTQYFHILNSQERYSILHVITLCNNIRTLPTLGFISNMTIRFPTSTHIHLVDCMPLVNVTLSECTKANNGNILVLLFVRDVQDPTEIVQSINVESGHSQWSRRPIWLWQ